MKAIETDLMHGLSIDYNTRFYYYWINDFAQPLFKFIKLFKASSND